MDSGFSATSIHSPPVSWKSHPAAPYDREPDHWRDLPWYDRRTAQPISTVNAANLGNDPERLADALTSGVVPLRTIGQILHTYDARPEHKSLSPDGTPTGPTTAGQLRRRSIRSATVLTAHIGKEGNRLLERATGEITDPSDYRTTYIHPDNDGWRELVLPVLRDIGHALGIAHIARRVGVTERQVRNWVSGRAEPHAGATENRQRAERLAGDWATEQLLAEGRRVPRDSRAALYAYNASSYGDRQLQA